MTNTTANKWVCPKCGFAQTDDKFMESTPDLACPKCGTSLGNFIYMEL